MSVVMPQLGESIVEATLARWLVQPGESVSRGQILAEIETDKATNELPAPDAGVIGHLLIKEGETVAVGTPILDYEGQDTSRTASPVTETSTANKNVQAPSGRLPSNHLAPRPTSSAASPAVRRIARERGLDLELIAGSGRHGRITREDVLEYTPTPEPIPSAIPDTLRSESSLASVRPSQFKVYRPPNYKPTKQDQVVPFSRRRSFIAEHMVHSLGTAAHVAAVTEIDMGAVKKARETDRIIAEQRGIHLTYTAYVVSAVAQALHAFPELNATVDGEQVILRQERNVGVAVNTDLGLIVPVIQNADELGLFGIARSLTRLSEKARNNELTATDLSGGSFTVSNPGRDGNLFGVSIIRQPEVGILRMGSVVKRPVVKELEGEDIIVVRPIMYAALSYDHRVIDGSSGNGFLHQIRTLLENTVPMSDSFISKNR